MMNRIAAALAITAAPKSCYGGQWAVGGGPFIPAPFQLCWAAGGGSTILLFNYFFHVLKCLIAGPRPFQQLPTSAASPFCPYLRGTII